MKDMSENSHTSVLPLVDNEYRIMSNWSIANAEKSILLATFLFNLNPSQDRELHVRKFTRALCDASWRGVDVRVLLGAPAGVPQNRSNRVSAQYLARRGIKVRTLKNPEHHLKFMLFDTETAIIGSHNITPSAIAQNYETSVLIKNAVVSKNVEKVFYSFWEQSEPHEVLIE